MTPTQITMATRMLQDLWRFHSEAWASADADMLEFKDQTGGIDWHFQVAVTPDLHKEVSCFYRAGSGPWRNVRQRVREVHPESVHEIVAWIEMCRRLVGDGYSMRPAPDLPRPTGPC